MILWSTVSALKDVSGASGADVFAAMIPAATSSI